VHVLIEKPLAASVAEAQALTQMAQKAGLTLQVGHIERFNPTFVELRNVLVGHTILAVEARRLSPFATRAADVSVVYDLMIHDLDLILTLMSELVIAAQAVGRRAQSPQLDHVLAFLSFADGCQASLSASRSCNTKSSNLPSPVPRRLLWPTFWPAP
jgi:predicted dehydrogenase